MRNLAIQLVLQQCAKQVATSFILYFLVYTPRQKGKQNKNKRKEQKIKKDKKKKNINSFLVACLGDA